ncbi:flagellar biosynthetic protein FliR [Methylomonas sp. AM2-LC]|uniref:flagellar biosynthetic protein FliR n=1 Tax=Methylomonas sp. AM2-LC TaxID=3153301 RepID=UPI0032639205
MTFTEEQLLGYLATFIWPFLRMGSMFITIPVFGVSIVPARVRVMAGLLITIVILPTLPAIPTVEIFSFQGWMIAMQQIMLGMCSGFILQMVLSIMLFAGQSIAYSMGLGFASMVDPSTGVQVPVIAQLFVIASSFIFLSVNGHLLLIEMLAQSFHTLPVSMLGFEKTDLWRIIIWSSQIFADGLLLALPIMATMLFVNISFGVASKAAPQLQIFGVGFPITIIIGMLLIWVGVPSIIDGFTDMLQDSYTFISQLLRLN